MSNMLLVYIVVEYLTTTLQSANIHKRAHKFKGNFENVGSNTVIARKRAKRLLTKHLKSICSVMCWLTPFKGNYMEGSGSSTRK